MSIDCLIEAGRPLDAWELIRKLPRRLLFTNKSLRQQYSCAVALGWERKATILAEVLSKRLNENFRDRCSPLVDLSTDERVMRAEDQFSKAS